MSKLCYKTDQAKKLDKLTERGIVCVLLKLNMRNDDMDTKHMWAQVHQYTVAIMLLCLCGPSLALPVDNPIPVLWKNPGQHPFTDSPLKACQLHESTSNLPVDECMRGVRMSEAMDGQCKEDILLDGDRLYTTLTKNGKSWSQYVQVAFKYPSGHPLAGKPLPLDHEKRKAKICRLNRSDGATVVYPYVCGNWSIMFLPPEPIEEVVPAAVLVQPEPIAEEPASKNCRWVNDSVTETPGVGVYVSAVHSCGCYAPEAQVYIQAQTQTSSQLVCD